MSNIVHSSLESLVHIGAGKCQALAQYLASNAKRIILVEPMPKLVSELQKKAYNEPRLEVFDVAISDELTPLKEFNLLEASSLYSPVKLKELFPGIKVVCEHDVGVKSASDFIAGIKLSGNNNSLIIEASGAEQSITNSLIKGKKLDLFSHIEILASDIPLYNNESSGATAVEVLMSQGFDVDTQKSVDTDWTQWSLSRNPLQQSYAAMKVKFEQIETKYLQSQSEVERLSADFGSESTLLKTKLLELQNEFLLNKQDYRSRSKKQDEKLSSLEKELEDARHQLRMSEGMLIEANNRLDESRNNADRFESIEAQLKMLSSDITGHVDQKLLESNRQLESFIGLQGYLEHGEMPLNYQGERISSELAVSLVEKVESNNYDLIIEFGSGASTALFAKSVLNQSLKGQPLTLHNKVIDPHSAHRQDITHVSPGDDDLPKRVISFEHNKEEYQKTQQVLNANGLEKVVELVLAPLVDYSYKGEEYLHYACDATLNRLGSMFEGREAKILVLVDGPSVANNSQAQFPALPKLLNTLSAHALHVVLHAPEHDSNSIIIKWKSLLSERDISMNTSPQSIGSSAVFMVIGGGS